MKKRIAAAILSVCLCFTLCPGALAAEGAPARGVLTYTEVVAPQYEDAHAFSEGLAAVKRDGKWGYIDTAGETVIPFCYDMAFSFSEGLAVVGTFSHSSQETVWIRDPEMEEPVPCEYLVYHYELGFVDQENGYTPFLRETGDGTETEPLTYLTIDEVYSGSGLEMIFRGGYVCLSEPGSPFYRLYDTAGRAVRDSGGALLTPYGYQVTEGVVITGDPAAEDGAQRYYDMGAGEWVTPLHDEEDYWVVLRPFNQGLAPAALVNWENQGLWGVVNREGRWVIPPAYADFMVNNMETEYRVFGDTGLAVVMNTDEKWGAIDREGRTVIPFLYDDLRPYHFGLAAFCQDGKYGYLDGTGGVAIPARYERTSGFGGEGFAVAYDGERAFLIDTEGNEIPGAEQLDPDTYFSVGTGEDLPTVYLPDEYVVIRAGERYGFGHVEYQPPLPGAVEMHSWAHAEVTAAIQADLVPAYLQNLYTNDINREEFCSLVMQTVCQILGRDEETLVAERTGKSLTQWQREYPFSDSTDANIIAAYALGIVTGRGDGTFDPYAAINRQEAAVFLTRAANVLGMDTANTGAAGFADSKAVSVWAADAVNFVYQAGVMNGREGNRFAPLDPYTREQSFMTVYRLFQVVTAA